MFYSDKPIEKIKEDFLYRKPFCEDIYNALRNYNKNESLVIAVSGEWGYGKTSILNMIEDLSDPKKEIIIRFNPWLVSNRKQLISDFLTELSLKLEKINKNKEIKNLGKSLKAYSKALKPLSLIPAANVLAKFIEQAMRETGEALESYGEFKEEDILTLKKEINDYIRKYPKKIIVMIDDIDRLADDEIKEIFTLIRSISDFENIIYILAFDRRIIEKALDTLQEKKGAEYLEKIVQVVLEVPIIDEELLNDIFFKRLNESIPNLNKTNMKQEYFNELFYNGLEEVIKQCIRNYRDLGRFFNTLDFDIEFSKIELNVFDYLVITFFKVYENSFYNFIKNSRFIFLGEKNYLLDKDKRIKQYTKEIEENLSKLKRIKEETALILLKRVFPKIREYYDGNLTVVISEEYEKENRICTKENFANYFKFSISSYQISNEELINFLESNTREKQKYIINEILKEKKIKNFLKKLRLFIDKLSLENSENCLLELSRIGNEIVEKNRNFQYNSPVYDIIFIARNVLNKMKNEERNELVKKIITEIDDKDPYFYYYLIRSLIEINEEKLFNAKDIEIFIEMISQKTEFYFKEGNNTGFFIEILYILKKFNKVEIAKKFINIILKRENGVLDILKLFISESSISNGYSSKTVKHIYIDYIDEFFNSCHLEKEIKKLPDNIQKENIELIKIFLKKEKSTDRLRNKNK